MSKHWTLDDIPWQAFDPDKVDPDILTAIKAASMVEQDSDDYVAYLCRVFHDDADFRRAARAWGDEELQHGQALGRWAALADPSFDFARSFARYTEEHQLPLDATESVRGSRSTELIARCMVEVGTSLFYSAVRDATEEPVLKAICRHIAKDEVRHYKLFYSHGQRYLARERPLLITRLKAAFGRLAESNDDELAYAYYCGLGETAPYSRRRYNQARQPSLCAADLSPLSLRSCRARCHPGAQGGGASSPRLVGGGHDPGGVVVLARPRQPVALALGLTHRALGTTLVQQRERNQPDAGRRGPALVGG